jgi:hypothetical protein
LHRPTPYPHHNTHGARTHALSFLDMDGTRAFGRPSGDDHLLRPGELASRWFGHAHGFRVVADGVEVEKPQGRELSLFLAAKR